MFAKCHYNEGARFDRLGRSSKPSETAVSNWTVLSTEGGCLQMILSNSFQAVSADMSDRCGPAGEGASCLIFKTSRQAYERSSDQAGMQDGSDAQTTRGLTRTEIRATYHLIIIQTNIKFREEGFIPRYAPQNMVWDRVNRGEAHECSNSR